MIQLLYGNAVTLTNTLGGGRNGHIGILMKHSLHAALLTILYGVPNVPGVTPTIPDTAAAALQQQLKKQRKEGGRIFGNHSNIDDTLRTYIIDAVDDMNICKLR